MTRQNAWLRIIPVILTLGLLTPATQSAAQTITTYAVGYADGDETGLGLLGAQIRPGGLGWQPVGSLEGFILGYPDGAGGETTVVSITPSAGIHLAGENGAFSARGGYQIISDEDSTTAFFGGGESGPVGTVQGMYWGMTPMVEGLATYNFTSRFLWTQAQAFLPVLPVSRSGSIDLGAEYVFQGDLDDEDTRAQLIGPLARWATGTGAWIIGSGGLKNNLGPADNTWYGRITAVIEF